MRRKTYDYQRYAAYRRPPVPVRKKRHTLRRFAVAFVLLLAVGYGLHVLAEHHATKRLAASSTSVKTTKTQAAKSQSAKNTVATTSTLASPPSPAPCDGNTLNQNIIISIGKQHLWACDGAKQLYDSAVVTGMEQYPADLTPTGTYHVYSKQTNQTLKGCDNTGCWSDPVSYWMPWLDNKYGQYGFHDATWRSASDFGNIDVNAPSSAAEHGSHGCVELPLAAAKWLYDWSQVGTTVTIQS